MFDKGLMARHAFLAKELEGVSKLLAEGFNKLELKDKIKCLIQDSQTVVSFLGTDSYYTGCEDVSLYDDLYWQRYETRTLADILDMAIDDCEDEDEVEFILTSNEACCVVVRDMLNNGIGTARFEW